MIPLWRFYLKFIHLCPVLLLGINFILHTTAEIEDPLLHNQTLQSLESCNGPGSDRNRNLVFNVQCVCKKYVRGTYCTECKPSSFFLNGKNKHGCLRCICSGLSKRCSSAGLYRHQIRAKFKDSVDGFSLVYRNRSRITDDLAEDSNQIHFDKLPQKSNQTYYWMLPEKFLKEKLTSYGGHLNFDTEYHYLPRIKGYKKWLKDPLIYMHGNGMTLHYRQRKGKRNSPQLSNIPLSENGWFKESRKRKRTAEKGRKLSKRRKRAKRKDMMKVLTDIDYILIKANYKPMTTMVALRKLKMSYGSEVNSSGGEIVANKVENCDCPQGYGGLSCQLCSQGFTRDVGAKSPSSPGYPRPPCTACRCHGRAHSCHPVTGVCTGCQNNTTGDYCQKSLLKCDPRGIDLMQPDPTKCRCKARVEGDLCDTCRKSYFDLDFENEKRCRKCWCSGVSLRCKSSTLRRFRIRIQPQALIKVAFKQRNRKKIYLINFYNGKALYRPLTNYRKVFKLHWSLPKIFTGNLLKSYGGYLNFSLTNRGHCPIHKPAMNPLLELESFSGRILIWKFSPPIRMNSQTSFSIRLIEEHFVHTYDQLGSSRSTFLEVLKDLRSIRIYVPDCSHISSTEIGDIVLDTSTDSDTAFKNPVATAVEQCNCSPAYSGTSCEYCSPGYAFDASRRCVRKSSRRSSQN